MNAKTNSRLGEFTHALLQALEDGPMTRAQLREYNLMPSTHLRHYLRRCEFRGLLTVERNGKDEVFTVSPTWRDFLGAPPVPTSTPGAGKGNRVSSVFEWGAPMHPPNP